jgi:hypothetical protein
MVEYSPNKNFRKPKRTITPKVHTGLHPVLTEFALSRLQIRRFRDDFGRKLNPK